MKNKVTMAIMMLFLVSVLPSVYATDSQSSIIDGLNEGETTVFVLDGENYAVTAIIIEDVNPASVTFEVNGEISNQLSVGQSQHFNNLELEINNIFISEGESLTGDKVKMRIACNSDCDVRYDHDSEYPIYVDYLPLPDTTPKNENDVYFITINEGESQTIKLGKNPRENKEILILIILNLFYYFFILILFFLAKKLPHSKSYW